ncbi:MAG: hypothetical protein K1X88_31660 [Nannocystaceae bacterium]|nr:hypothetical protein [Nannocystaceae bacterium]
MTTPTRRLAALLSLLLAAVPACYDPERNSAPPSQAQGKADAPGANADGSDDAPECVGDCEICVHYCATMLACSADPPEGSACLDDCAGALAYSSEACSEARREAMRCVGALDCGGYSSPDACVAELAEFQSACEGEYDEQTRQPGLAVAS